VILKAIGPILLLWLLLHNLPVKVSHRRLLKSGVFDLLKQSSCISSTFGWFIVDHLDFIHRPFWNLKRQMGHPTVLWTSKITRQPLQHSLCVDNFTAFTIAKGTFNIWSKMYVFSSNLLFIELFYKSSITLAIVNCSKLDLDPAYIRPVERTMITVMNQ